MTKVPSRSKEELFANAFKDGSIERWARAGATDKQIAENIGISRDTFYNYLKAYPDVLDTLHRARKPVVIEAFEGLVRLSRGYHEKTTRKHIKTIKDKKGNVISKVEEIFEDDTYIAPQHQACTKVIVNYLNQIKKHGSGTPVEYVNEPAISTDAKDGRLSEMEQAMRQLFFGEGK